MSENTKFIDNATLMKIAKGGKAPVKVMSWGKTESMHVPISMWLEECGIEPGVYPIKASSFYSYFVSWAENKHMDFIASYNKFVRVIASHLAATTESGKKVYYINKILYDQKKI